MVDSSNIADWIDNARQDLKAAEILLNNEGPNNVTAFLLQQSIEKVLKAYLLHQSGKLKKGHSIGQLNGLCANFNALFEEYQDSCEIIDDYYIETRYPPDTPIEISEEELKEAKDVAEKLFNRVTSQI